jgi:hypothetical protein
MRDAINIKDAKVEVNGKRGKIVGFWLSANNAVYAKIKDYKGMTVNHKLSDLSESKIKVIDWSSDEDDGNSHPLFI